MEIEDAAKIEKIIRDRKEAHQCLINKGSATYKAFLAMEQAAYSDGSLDKKVKELIAIGISVVINCESCLEWHIHEALKSGSSQDQVLEAIEVGVEMGGGPATVSSRFALKVLDYYSQKGTGINTIDTKPSD